MDGFPFHYAVRRCPPLVSQDKKPYGLNVVPKPFQGPSASLGKVGCGPSGSIVEMVSVGGSAGVCP